MTREIYLSGEMPLDEVKKQIAARFDGIGLLIDTSPDQDVGYASDEGHIIFCGGSSEVHIPAIYEWILKLPGAYDVSRFPAQHPTVASRGPRGVGFYWAALGEPEMDSHRSGLRYGDPSKVLYGGRVYPPGSRTVAVSEGTCGRCQQAIEKGDRIKLLESSEQALARLGRWTGDEDRTARTRHEPCRNRRVSPPRPEPAG